MSEKAKISARTIAGKTLTVTDMKVLESGLTACIPTRAKMAELPKPRPETKARTTAVILGVRPAYSRLLWTGR